MGILHKTKKRYHTFDIRDAALVLNYGLNTFENLDIFTDKKPGKVFTKLWEPFGKKWNGIYIGHQSQNIQRNVIDEYLVFRCPCHSKNNIKNKCIGIVSAIDFLNVYIKKNTKEYMQLKNKIDSLTLKVYDLVYNRVIYCPNDECPNSSGIILMEKVNMEAGKVCEECKITWCPNCKCQPYHTELSCEEVSHIMDLDDENVRKERIMNIIKGNRKKFSDVKENIVYILKNAAICPKCNHAVIKIDGCDHMTCKCGTHFCWVCSATFKDYADHVIEHANTGNLICVNTHSKDRRKILRESRIATIKKIFGNIINRSEIDKIYKKVYNDIVNSVEQIIDDDTYDKIGSVDINNKIEYAALLNAFEKKRVIESDDDDDDDDDDNILDYTSDTIDSDDSDYEV
uniref:RBR-type E3 ubiquitin transferase n=1 Tax=Mimivirus LCMiAC01 TaxID=2506608 RepID=A0A481Z0L3_9VIRU|nr:MAG: hypothetical protein LCMiAC01_02840 [Mimivirus LCMiAC01]